MNEKKLTALISVLAFGLAGMALVPVGMDAGAEQTPLAQANEDYTDTMPTEPIYTAELEYGTLYCEKSGPTLEIIGFTNNELTPPPGAVLELPSEIDGMDIVYVRWGAFRCMVGISEIVFPATMNGVGEHAIYAESDCLERVHIPATMGGVGRQGFRGDNIKTITFEPVSNDSLSLEYFAFANCGVTELNINRKLIIEDYVFSECTALEKVTLGKEVTELGWGMFQNCTALKEVSFTNAITSTSHAFFGCTALEDIYFDGSVDEWNNITVSEHDAESIANAEIHCNSYANLNGDMSIDAEDSFMILNASALAGSGMDSGLTEQQIFDADVNFDGKYDAQDAATILQYAAAFGSGEKVTLADFLQ